MALVEEYEQLIREERRRAFPEHPSDVCIRCGSPSMIRGDICTCPCGYAWRWLLMVGMD